MVFLIVFCQANIEQFSEIIKLDERREREREMIYIEIVIVVLHG